MAQTVQLSDRLYVSMIPDEIKVSSSAMVTIVLEDLVVPQPIEVSVMMHRDQARRLAAHIITALAEED